jgi:hypothetical protein
MCYGGDAVAMGPRLENVGWKDGEALLGFSNVGGGLIGRETIVVSGDKSDLIGKNVKIVLRKGSYEKVLVPTDVPGRKVVRLSVDFYDLKGNQLKHLKSR